MALTFSKYQWGLIKILKRRMITDEEAPFIDQRPFNSLCRKSPGRPAIVVKIQGGFSLNDVGLQVVDEYDHADVTKSHASKNLGKYVSMLRTIRLIHKESA